MAKYDKTNWVDRVVEKPMTFNIQNNIDGTVTLIPAEGVVTSPGTPVTASYMNNLESGVKSIDLKSDCIKGTTQIAAYVEGDITSMFHQDSNGVVVRTDTFDYSPTLITETRTLASGESLTYKYYFDENGDFIRTEVI